MKKACLFLLFTLPGLYSYAQDPAEESKQTEKRIAALESKVEKMNRLKISGYIQTQWSWNEAGIAEGDQNDFSVRRGRLKAAYANPYGEAVIQIDATEDGVKIKDAYLKVGKPGVPWVAFRGGVFNRPFGYEISYSSSRRESPERSRIFQTLFPRERDLGGELIFEGPSGSFLRNFTLNMGLFSGNGGQSKETDSRKDFIGHLAYGGRCGSVVYGMGASLYAGGVRLAGEEGQKAYRLEDGVFVEDAGLVPGKYAKRHYYGFDGQISIGTALGLSSLHGEYLWGSQPGAEGNSKSPTGAIVTDIYQRKFNGYYLQLVQDFGPGHALVVKYDAYDPNTKLAENNCQTVGDIAYSAVGFGWLFRANRNLRVTCYYEMTYNEKVSNNNVAAIYGKDVRDDVFTLRLQYTF